MSDIVLTVDEEFGPEEFRHKIVLLRDSIKDPDALKEAIYNEMRFILIEAGYDFME